MKASVFLALLILAVVWGSAFPVIKVGLEGLSFPHLTLLRHLVASLCLVPVLLLLRKPLLPARRDIPGFLLLGAVGMGLYHTTLNAGEVRVSAGATSLIIAATPALSALLARFALGERLPLLGWGGSLISFLGIILIVLGDSASLGFDAYALLVVFAALCSAVFLVGQKPFLGRYSAVQVTAFATWGATVPLLIFLPGFAADLQNSGPSLPAAVYLGVFPSAFTYTLLAYALSQNAVSLVGTFLYGVPVFAMLFAWGLLGEVPSSLTLLGGLVVIAGIVVVNIAKGRQTRAARTARNLPVAAPAAVLHRPRR